MKKNALKYSQLYILSTKGKNVYLEDLLIDLVAVVRTAGLAGGSGLIRGEASTSGKDPDDLSDVSDGRTGKAEGCPVNVVLDLKTIVKYY